MGKFKEKTLKKRRIYKGRIVSLREDTVKLSTGRVAKREIVEHKGAVAIIAICGKDKIVLVKQFRKPADRVLYEIPAGLANKGESDPAAAKRELEEETGFLAGRVKKVFEGYSSPGYSTEVIKFFVATNLKKTKQRSDDDELIDVMVIPIRSCSSLIKKGMIKDNKTLIGIMLAQKAIKKKA